jgi:hypothetical protein
MLTAIETSLNTTRFAVAAAEKNIDNEDLFKQIFELLALFGDNATIQQDVAALKAAVTTLQTSQTQCVLSLIGYTEGMMCFSCAANATQFVDTANLALLLSEDTCTGVTNGCIGVFDSAHTILKTILRIVSNFAPVDETQIDNMPDMCGGTEAAPGNCTEFICNNVLQGVRIPNYDWDINGLINNTGLSDSVSPANLAAVLLKMTSKKTNSIRRAMSAVAAAATVKNVYVKSGGYPALAVGCSGDACGTSSTAAPSSSHTVAIAVGVTAGVVVLLVAIVVVVRQRSSGRSGEDEASGMLMEGQKGYRTV